MNDDKVELIQSGLEFIRSITKNYGSEEGMTLWNKISEVLDPTLKGDLFFAMISGEYNNQILIKAYNSYYDLNKIDVIKAIRTITGYGLKEAKETADLLWSGIGVKIPIEPTKRLQAMIELRKVGLTV